MGKHIFKPLAYCARKLHDEGMIQEENETELLVSFKS